MADSSFNIGNVEKEINELVVDNLTTDDATKALSAKQGKLLNSHLGNIPVIEFGSTTLTTTGNANISLDLDASQYNLLSVTVTSPADQMALPCLYSAYGNGILGAHIVSILNAMSPLTNTSVTVKYAYVKRQEP